MKINTNLKISSNGSPPRTRYDRLYFRSSIMSNITFKPVEFELKGLEKLANINFFCSDHWAIQCYFEI